MRKSTTKRALLMSGLAMLLSISMLVGTTFAWFTDTVSSGTNQIVAGNLDIELYHSNKEVTDEKVEPTTKLFTDVALWEPGAMVYEKFTVANLGDLALKYQFTLNALNATEVEDANGNKVSFASMLKVAVVEKANYNYDRAAILADTTLNWNPIETFTLSGELAKTESDVFGIIIYWQPSDNDNLFNMNNANKGKQVSIDLGVTLFATQDNVEADGFDSTYDENAWADGMQVFNANDLQSAINNAEPGDEIVVMDDIDFDGEFVIQSANATTYSLRANGVVIDLNGHKLSADSITTDGVATIVNGTLVLPAEGNVYACDETAISLENVEIVSDGISAYAVRNGSVSLKNVTFVNTATSNPVQNYGGNMTLENVTVAQAGDANTAWYSSAVQVINLLVQDENGKYGITAQADTVINSGTYTGKKAVMISAPGGNVTINGGTFNGSEYAIQADFAPQYYTDGANYTSVITINGGTFNGAIKATPDAKVVIYGGTFSHDPSAYVAEGYSAVANTDGSYTVLKGDVAASDNAGLNDAIANGESNVALGKGEFSMPATSGDVTISGTTDTVITVYKPTANKVTLNGVTVVGSGAYTGIQHSDTVVYENCVVKGVQFLYANNVTFKNCTIDLTEVVDYIWTYTAKNVEFIDCTFNTNGKAILVYAEDANLVTNVTVKGCTFNATGSALAGGKVAAAIEIDSSLATNGKYTITTENNVVDPDFSGEWRVKNSGTNNTTVNGVVYNKVSDGLYKGEGTAPVYYVYNAEGLATLNTMMNNDTAGKAVVVNLVADIDFAGKTWTPVDSHVDFGFYLKEINGNGYTISNLTINGQAMFTRFSCGAGNDVVIKDVTFDNATVNSGSLNTAIIVGQTYNNLVLDNVDVKNSSVTGGYKVATLVGTVYNESASAITLSVKNCDVDNCTVTTTQYDFMTCGLVAFVYVGDNDSVVFENTTISNVALANTNSGGYSYHAFVYYNDQDTNDCFNEAEGVTVSGCTFENK